MNALDWFAKFVEYASKYGPAVKDFIATVVDEFEGDHPELREPPAKDERDTIDDAVNDAIDRKFPKSDPPA